MTTSLPRSPLEDRWVEHPLILFIEGQTITGTARASWGTVHVAITSPIVGLCRQRDSRGWSFAMLAHNRPESRYAMGGELTVRGLELARQMLTNLYLDWRAVSSHWGEVDDACRRARQELADLDHALDVKLQPYEEERSVLRRSFKAGRLTQQEHQRIRKEIRRLVDRLRSERYQQEEMVRQHFAVWLQQRCGRKIALDEAEKLLTDAGMIVPASHLLDT